MSWEVVGLVSPRQCGGAVRRVLLLTLANRASNDGRDIWASVGTLARDAEVNVRTVQRYLREFIAEGLLEQVGQRPCFNGYTNEYRLRLSKIRALPMIPRGDEEHEQTGDSVSPLTESHPCPPVTGDAEPPASDGHRVTECHQTGDSVSPNPVQEPIQLPTPERARDVSLVESDVDRCLSAAGPWLADPSKAFGLIRSAVLEIARWKRDGADFDLDILPVVIELTNKPPRDGEPIENFSYFTKAVRKAAALRMAPAEPIQPAKGGAHGRTGKRSIDLDATLERAQHAADRIQNGRRADA